MKFRNIQLGWRNIRKNSVFSIINISGLSIALAVVVLILFWVVHELSFDKFNDNLDRIYTVYEHQQFSNGQELHTNSTPFPLAATLKDQFAEVERATTFLTIHYQLFGHNNQEYRIDQTLCADTNFLEVFSYQVVEGDPKSLHTSNQIMITPKTAHWLFGDENPIGKVVHLNNTHPLTIGAIIEAKNQSSTQYFNAVVPIKKVAEVYGADLNSWNNNHPSTCVLLAEGCDTEAFNSKITNIAKDKGQDATTLHLFPFKKERLYSYSGESNRIQYVYQFLAIALIIIIIASINFINLSTAKAEQRRPEVKVYKVLGASKLNVLKQFLSEKGILILLAIAISSILVQLLIPVFQTLSGKTIDGSFFHNQQLIIMMFAVILSILLLSVVYPSLYLASFGVLLKGRGASRSGISGNRFKSILVVVQFTFAIALICCSIIVSKQIRYVNQYDLGYNHDNLVYIPLDGAAREKHGALKQELSHITNVQGITRSDKLPAWGGNSSWGHTWEGKDPENNVLICKIEADKDYFTTLGIELVDGKGFPESYNEVVGRDETMKVRIVLNQEAIKRMQLPNPVGKEFRPWDYLDGEIVGVVKDFHFTSLHVPVEPMMMFPLTENPAFVIVRLGQGNLTQTLDEIKEIWASILPGSACEIGFFDDRLAQLYNDEVRISSLFRYFTLVAIFISCIGLLGLSLFIVQRKVKEIGIRKVNGARIRELMYMLNKSFVNWIIIAILIASPLAYYTMSKWLENFACRTPINWWIFALAGAMALTIALITVSWQSWRAASRNPVDALRYE